MSKYGIFLKNSQNTAWQTELWFHFIFKASSIERCWAPDFWDQNGSWWVFKHIPSWRFAKWNHVARRKHLTIGRSVLMRRFESGSSGRRISKIRWSLGDWFVPVRTASKIGLNGPAFVTVTTTFCIFLKRRYRGATNQ